LSAAGYDAARPPRSGRARVIQNPSHIGGWATYVARQGHGFLRAKHFHGEFAGPRGLAQDIRADAVAPYDLAFSAPLELPVGRYRWSFHGRCERSATVRCEVSGFTGRNGQHAFAVETTALSRSDQNGSIAVLSFELGERAANVVAKVSVHSAQGAVTFGGIFIEPVTAD
jgi:hypothetical protein